MLELPGDQTVVDKQVWKPERDFLKLRVRMSVMVPFQAKAGTPNNAVPQPIAKDSGGRLAVDSNCLGDTPRRANQRRPHRARRKKSADRLQPFPVSSSVASRGRKPPGE